MFALLLAAAAGNDSGTARKLIHWELSRLAQFDDPRTFWAVLGALGLVTLFYVVWLYRRESVSLSRTAAIVFPLLRLVAWLGAALYFLGLEKRIDQEVVRDSQVAVLVDTSQSMSVKDVQLDSDSSQSRSAAIAAALQESSLLNQLRKNNDVEVLTFDRQMRRIAGWPRLRPHGGDVDDLRSELLSSDAADQEPVDWPAALEPRGTETRLGDALLEVLKQQRQGPLAGVVVISDGGQNVGIDPLSLLDGADREPPPFYAVGLGSKNARKNLRVQELAAPSRVYPSDSTTVTGVVHAGGFAGRTVEVQLFAREAQADAASAVVIDQKSITLDQNQQTLPVEFEIEPKAIGGLNLRLQIVAPADDQYSEDDSREVEVEVVEANTHVLLIAGGASRDYQFLRNQLYRDEHATVDVWIQSAHEGISQEADKILLEFPSEKDELYEYDCIIAFDANWEFLDARQVDLLESWVAEEAGGLIVVAGPVYTLSWSQSPELAKIRALYPVEFQRRLTLLDDGLYGSKTPWPILFTREGEDATYLWLAENEAESRMLWTEFPGVYGCYAVKGPKPGARVLGWYGDPDASLSQDYPVYMAEQFYGSGRVFYVGSGELWRLRALDPAYFEFLTTRLIRHVSQGRLLKGSSHGRLMVEQDRYTVGDDVVVRAQVLSSNREPLTAEQLTARLVDNRGESQPLQLAVDQNRPGNYLGQLSVLEPGTYSIELSLPDAVDERLVRKIQVVTPDLEFDDTRRNEDLLLALAERTQGRYYPTLPAAIFGEGDLAPIEQLIPSRAETRTLRGTPDGDFTRWLNTVLLGVICGALCLEWLLRRLMKLA